MFNINPDPLLDLRDSERLTYDSLGVKKKDVVENNIYYLPVRIMRLPFYYRLALRHKLKIKIKNKLPSYKIRVILNGYMFNMSLNMKIVLIKNQKC